MENKKVKGTMLINLVRMIRQNKNLDWDKYLLPEDWEIVNSRIMLMNWYPLDLYRRCGIAAFMLIAKKDFNMVRFSGKVIGQEMFTKIYKSIIATKDPKAAIQQFIRFYGSLFNFSTLRLESSKGKHLVIHHDYDPNDRSNVPYCYQLMGILDALIELTGGKNPKVNLVERQWKGAQESVFDVQWQ